MDTRRPVSAVTKGDLIIVVCDDGSVWSLKDVTASERWTERRPIPGSEADVEDSN